MLGSVIRFAFNYVSIFMLGMKLIVIKGCLKTLMIWYSFLL